MNDLRPMMEREILVDRLWPRGLKKTDAAIDQWMKDIALQFDA
jgi:uncharacterized protein YeaO (DUF488 family)